MVTGTETLGPAHAYFYDLARHYGGQGVAVRYDLCDRRIVVGAGSGCLATGELPEEALYDTAAVARATAPLIVAWARALAKAAEEWEGGLPPTLRL